MFHKLLVANDGSRGGERAFQCALELVRTAAKRNSRRPSSLRRARTRLSSPHRQRMTAIVQVFGRRRRQACPRARTAGVQEAPGREVEASRARGWESSATGILNRHVPPTTAI